MAHPHNSGGVTDLPGPWFTHPGAGGFAVAIALWGYSMSWSSQYSLLANDLVLTSRE